MSATNTIASSLMVETIENLSCKHVNTSEGDENV